MATAAKKTNKVEIPIDERETFVSLQKSFADSELSVEQKLKVLYALQEADNEIEKIKQLRGDLPREVEALEDEIAALSAKSAHNEDMIREFENAIEAGKKRIVELDGDISKYQQQLENIANSREFDSINKELENLGLLRSIEEKHIGEARVQIEERKSDIETIAGKIAIREDDLAAKKEELSTIVESTASEEEVLTARRNECAAKIDARTMSAYNRIRASVNNHLAVVAVYKEDSCGGCFSTITPQRLVDIASGKKLVICEHCGRIIVNPAPSDGGEEK